MSPLGKIILARAAVIGARRGPGIPAKDLSLTEMSELTGGQLTRAAINEWILGRVKNPNSEKLVVLAKALASDVDYPTMALLNDMRAAVGMPHQAAPRTVDLADLAEADIEALQVFADRLREKGREAAALAHAATDRATRFSPATNGFSQDHHDDAAVAGR